jgi:hypothetical protein
MRGFAAHAVLFAACLSSAAAQINATVAANHDQETVRKLSDQEVQAFLDRDPGTLAELWSDDFVVTNPLNQFVNKQQVLDLVRSGMLVITTFSRQVEYARTYGSTVILAGEEKVVWGGRMPNAGKPEQLRFTAVWMKQKGKWQQVARHANIVPGK